ncbi:hypothetical protein ACFE04_007458 [Oxalis oulophora]
MNKLFKFAWCGGGREASGTVLVSGGSGGNVGGQWSCAGGQWRSWVGLCVEAWSVNGFRRSVDEGFVGEGEGLEDRMEREKRYPVNAADYKLYEEVGEGASAIVYRALCVPFNEIVAIKVLDLEKCNNDLDGMRREVQIMTLTNHANLLKGHCSFTAGSSLWVVMPYMSAGSCLHIMKTNFPDGFEEPIIVTLLRETLKAIVYLHYQGHIHRDVKAGNILIDSNGSVKLADFGVSACMFDTGDRQRSRNTFVGTPCWMAPEVMQQLHGYDFKADIWSFGITALELAHGHAPFSKYPPMKVLLMTLQNAPPGLDYERDKRFSKTFREMISTCLVKDPKQRPTSENLLQHSFFKRARSDDYVARKILDGLSPLGERFKLLKANEAQLLMQNKALHGDKDHLSQQEYIRGISAWNFNLEDLKSQAALIPDDDIMNAEDVDVNMKQMHKHDSVSFLPETLSPDSGLSRPDPFTTSTPELVIQPNVSPSRKEKLKDLESPLASFPVKPLQALEGCFDVGEDEEGATRPTTSCTGPDSERRFFGESSSEEIDQESRRIESGNNSGQSSSIPHQKNFLSRSLIPEHSFASKKPSDGDRDLQRPKIQPEQRNYSGPLYLPRKDTNNAAEDSSDGAVVQCKGRFKITSADLSSKFSSGGSTSPTNLTLTSAAVLPSLHGILQQNSTQREEIVRLIKYVEQMSGNNLESASGLLQTPPASVKERELLSHAIQLQQSIGSLTEELQRLRFKNAQSRPAPVFFAKVLVIGVGDRQMWD